jgi:hypothetical protein
MHQVVYRKIVRSQSSARGSYPTIRSTLQSHTIDKMVYGVNDTGFQTMSSAAQQEHMSSENDLVAKHQL